MIDFEVDSTVLLLYLKPPKSFATEHEKLLSHKRTQNIRVETQVLRILLWFSAVEKLVLLPRFPSHH